MKLKYRLLHEDMLADIERCMRVSLPEKERVDSCFWIAFKNWKEIKLLLKNHVFADDNEEIEFFRNVKPQFTFYIEYFLFLSEALLFIPEEKECVVEFWENERKRFERYCKINEKFVLYYESSERHEDHIYFLRNNKVRGYDPLSVLYDSDVVLSAPYDHVIRSYLALKKYEEYARGRLEGLGSSE